MRTLMVFIALVVLAVVAYKLYVSGAFSGPVAAQPGAPAAQAGPGGAAQQQGQPQQEAPPPKEAPRPGDVIGGVVKSGKRTGQGAAKAFGNVDFGGKQ
jgi:hypothetical protein